jgi:hypothetical protein
MGVPKYGAKRDTSESDIITALERAGAEVWPLDYPVDLLVRFRQNWHLLEVKTPYGKRAPKARTDKRQEAQMNFIATTGTPIVTTPLEALRAVGAVA